MTLLPRFARRAPLGSFALPLALIGLLGGVVIGIAGAHRPRVAVAAGLACMLVAIAVRRPVYLAIVALIGVYAGQRLGGASSAPGVGGGVSTSDALLGLATFLAVPAMIGTPELRRLRLPMLGLAGYLACLLPTVFLNPSSRGAIEWLHRLVLVGGGLLLGAWIVREGLTRRALRLLIVVSCVVAVAAIANTFARSFLPASPFGLNKNFIGALFGAVIVVAAAANKVVDFSPRRQALAVVVLAGGLVSSQSRGGMLAAVAGLLVAYTLDSRSHSRRTRAASVVVALGLAAFAIISVRSQLNQSQEKVRLGSIGVRFNVEKETRKIWRTSPIDGVGLKYFYTGNYGEFAQVPNNIVDNELAESGVIGLVGFTVLQGCAIAAGVRRRRDGPLIGVGLGVVVGLLLHGQVDIYWIAGSSTLPFMIMGIALAQPARMAPTRTSERARGARAGTVAHA